MRIELIEKRVKELGTICAELPLVVANNGWNDHALELVRKLQYLSIVMDDDEEDGEELVNEIVSDISRHDDTLPMEEPQKEAVKSVGVYVFKDGKLLAGTRITPSGFNKICGPGGLVNNGESAHDAAIREAKEEFGIEPIDIVSFGRGQKGADGYEPELFLCTEYNGDPKCDEVEMTRPEWRTIGEYRNDPDALYASFKDGIEKLIFAVCGDDQTNRNDANSDDVKWITVKGAHIPIDSDGNLVGKVASKITQAKEETKEISPNIQEKRTQENEKGNAKSEGRGYFDPTVKQLNNVKLGEKIVDEKGVEYTADWRDRNTGKVFWTAEPYKGAGYVDTYSSEEVVSRTRLYGLKLRKV